MILRTDKELEDEVNELRRLQRDYHTDEPLDKAIKVLSTGISPHSWFSMSLLPPQHAEALLQVWFWMRGELEKKPRHIFEVAHRRRDSLSESAVDED